MLYRDCLYIMIGYLSGSILFARVFGRLLGYSDFAVKSADQNPGTANAFHYGGFWFGTLTLCGDLLKGFLPVYLYQKDAVPVSCKIALSLVMAAPVLGHIVPVFCPHGGGKGIAVSFGCLLGLFPRLGPFCLLACTFLFFTLILKISPDYFKTLVTYIVSAILAVFFFHEGSVTLGFILIAGLITVRLLTSPEEKGPFQMEAIWKY